MYTVIQGFASLESKQRHTAAPGVIACGWASSWVGTKTVPRPLRGHRGQRALAAYIRWNHLIHCVIPQRYF